VAGNNHIRCPQCGVPNEPGALFCSRCGASLNRPGYAGTRRRGVSAAGFAMALALLLALAILVFVLYTIVTRVLAPTETTLDPYAGTSGTVATLYTSTTGSATDSTGTTDAAGAIQVRPDSATASSSLTATLISDFQPTNLLDGDPASAWNEGAEGPGIGEWVLYDFGEPVPLARIEIANGYQRDEERFAATARVKSLELAYSDGTKQLVQLLDAQGLQTIKPAVKETAQITFTIISVYPRYEWEDAALSEIRVYESIGD
jgi:predicted nucleic acid-binding Zn ribbon protein